MLAEAQLPRILVLWTPLPKRVVNQMDLGGDCNISQPQPEFLEGIQK